MSPYLNLVRRQTKIWKSDRFPKNHPIYFSTRNAKFLSEKYSKSNHFIYGIYGHKINGYCCGIFKVFSLILLFLSKESVTLAKLSKQFSNINFSCKNIKWNNHTAFFSIETYHITYLRFLYNAVSVLYLTIELLEITRLFSLLSKFHHPCQRISSRPNICNQYGPRHNQEKITQKYVKYYLKNLK